MPKIPEYTSPETILRPSNEGASAFEVAGRRLGGAYRVAAEEQGKATGILGQVGVARGEWPFTILALQQEAANAATGGGFRVVGGSGGSGKGLDALGQPIQQFPNIGAINDQIAKAGNAASMLGAFDKFTNTMRTLLAPDGTLGDNSIVISGGQGQRIVDIGGGGDYGGGRDPTGALSSGPNDPATAGISVPAETGVTSGEDFGGYSTEGTGL